MADKINCNPYFGGEVPPCSAFLNNTDPIIKHGKIIFRNENRVFYFISTVPLEISKTIPVPITTDPIEEGPFTTMNLQISLATFVIGVYINQIQRGLIQYNQNNPIHSNKAANDFIHNLLQTTPNIYVDYIPKLSLIISNSNAILPFYTSTVNITPLNFYTLFFLNRFENDPGLFFANNSYTTADFINFNLAALNNQFPQG